VHLIGIDWAAREEGKRCCVQATRVIAERKGRGCSHLRAATATKTVTVLSRMSYPNLIRIEVLELGGSFPPDHLFEHSLAGLPHFYRVGPIQVSVASLGSTTIAFPVQTPQVFTTSLHRM
jgi:hypothetical protein